MSAGKAFRKAALKVYETVRQTGTQQGVIADMQTRDALYDDLDYHSYEKKLDELFTRERS